MNADAIGAEFVARLAADVALVELDGEGVLYDERTSAVHVLNATATVIASCLDGSGSLDDLAVDLARAYSLDVESIRGEVLELARSLGEKGLLDGVEGAATADHEVEQSEPAPNGPTFLADPPGT
jgi:PqqD family protein of HPr-rel-A system